MSKVVRRPYHYSAGPDVAEGRLLVEPSVVRKGKDVLVTATLTSDALGEFLDRSPEQTKPANTYTVAKCAAFIDVPPWAGGAPIPMTARDGNFGGREEDVTLLLNTGSLSVGRHIIYIQATDSDGNHGSTSAVFVTVEAADGDDVLYENNFEVLNLPAPTPGCGGAAFFGPDDFFNSAGFTFEEKPLTDAEIVVMNGVDSSNNPIFLQGPDGPDSGEYALGMFSHKHSVNGEFKEDVLGLFFNTNGYEYIEVVIDIAAAALPMSDCTATLPYVSGTDYYSELNLVLADRPGGVFGWGDWNILSEGIVNGDVVDGSDLNVSPSLLKWSEARFTFRADGSTDGQVALLFYFNGSALYNVMDNLVLIGKRVE